MELLSWEESVYWSWKSAGTAMSLSEWVTEQEALEEELQVKREEMDFELQRLGEDNNLFGSSIYCGAGVQGDPIDLSLH
jgi:hypothetical protein